MMNLVSQDDERWVIGVCAMERKVRSSAMVKILDHLRNMGYFEVIIFPEIDILEKRVDEWPRCDFLISFYSVGFPIDKAMEYIKMRKPFHLNNLPMQILLQDRRLLLRLLDVNDIPTLPRLVTQRYGSPRIEEDAKEVLRDMEMSIPEFSDEYTDIEIIDEDTLKIGSNMIRKPFVEKPVSAEDHNVYIYYPKARGGGGRRLYRKVRSVLSCLYFLIV